MSTTDGPSSIRAFITWHDQTVFAGEEVKCTITFKNVARTPGSSSSSRSRPSPQQSRHTSSERLKATSPRTKTNPGLAPPAAARGHRSSLSLSVPSSSAVSRARAGSIPWSPNLTDSSASQNGHSHKRSVSIVSIGSASTLDDGHSHPGSPGSAKTHPRAIRGHSRASSLQIVSRGPPISGPRSGRSPTPARRLIHCFADGMAVI